MRSTPQNYNDRICKIEFQMAQDREQIDSLMNELKHVRSQYDLAMKRINYLESELIRANSLFTESFAKTFNIN